uniref:Uncharacterized protein n=1 Tax=Triticum urartu TaxID=4572 RepID=A0A8R7PCG9_TRIUA
MGWPAPGAPSSALPARRRRRRARPSPCAPRRPRGPSGSPGAPLPRGSTAAFPETSALTPGVLVSPDQSLTSHLIPASVICCRSW